MWAFGDYKSLCVFFGTLKLGSMEKKKSDALQAKNCVLALLTLQGLNDAACREKRQNRIVFTAVLFCCCSFYKWREVGWGVREAVGSINEESQVRGCYSITLTCIDTNQETVETLPA